MATSANAEFRRRLRSWAKRSGSVLVFRTDSAYERARRIYNRIHDARPAVLVRCRDSAQLGGALQIATEHGVTVAIRGGGHHIAGFAMCEGGMVIDFSPFRRVNIDIEGGSVHVEPGARLGDLDEALCPLGYVIPTGTVSKTGVAGLTLGGGIGWLVGIYGLTCDHLIGADVVLADGRVVAAADHQHRDLLWALRGGGGNFGVVTKFKYRLRTLPRITAGSAVVALRNAGRALRQIFAFLDVCPRELTIAPVFRRNERGEYVLAIDFCLSGDSMSALRELRGVSAPSSWVVAERADFRRWQRAFDLTFEPPMRGYWKARYGTDLCAVDVDALIDVCVRAPVKRFNVLIEHLHGAIRDETFDTSAFPLREARVGVLVSARWRRPNEDARAIEWVRNALRRITATTFNKTYSNYAGDDDWRVATSYPARVSARLASVKSMYDPDNVFARNHNVRPLHTTRMI